MCDSVKWEGRFLCWKFFVFVDCDDGCVFYFNVRSIFFDEFVIGFGEGCEFF